MPSLKTNLFNATFRRSFALSTVLAGPLFSVAALAQTPAPTPKVVTQTITFSASNENYWPGAAGSLQPVQLFPKQPDGTNTITFTPPLPFSSIQPNLPQPGDSVDFSVSATNLKAGLTLNAYATPGGVNINYPGNLALTLDPQLTPNTAFNFLTSFTRDQANSNLAITPPNFDATLGGILAGDFNVSGIVRTPGHLPNFPFTILNKSVDTTFNIFDVQKDLVAPLEQYGGLGVYHDLNSYIKEIPAGVLSFEINDPRIFNFTNASAANSPTLSYNGYQTMLDLNGDISNLVGYLGYAAFTGGQSLPQGLFNASYSYGGSSDGYGATADASYQIADLYGDVPFGFEQNFTFQATPKMVIMLLGPTGKQIGKTATVVAGSGGSIQIPATYSDGTPVLPYGVTSVPITIQTNLDFSNNTLHNDTNFQCKPGLYFQPYSFSASASVEFASKNVFSVQDGFGYGAPITLASNTFSVKAFGNDKTVSDYSLSPSVVTSTINYIGTSIDLPHPTLTRLSQNSAVTGSNAFSLTLTGTGFTPKSNILITSTSPNGTTSQALLAKYVSPTSVNIQLPSAQLKVPATLSLSVSNPGLPKPATYVSNALPFFVAVPGCYLNAGASLVNEGPGRDALTLTMSNDSTIDATNVSISEITLNNVIVTKPGTVQLGTITSGTAKQMHSFLVSSSVLPTTAAAMQMKVTGTYNGTSFTTTGRIAVPPVQLGADASIVLERLTPVLSLTLRNNGPVDAANVKLSSITLDGFSSTTQAGPVGTIAAGASVNGGEYVFAPNPNLLIAASTPVTISGTANGKAFTLNQTVPISH